MGQAKKTSSPTLTTEPPSEKELALLQALKRLRDPENALIRAAHRSPHQFKAATGADPNEFLASRLAVARPSGDVRLPAELKIEAQVAIWKPNKQAAYKLWRNLFRRLRRNIRPSELRRRMDSARAFAKIRNSGQDVSDSTVKRWLRIFEELHGLDKG